MDTKKLIANIKAEKIKRAKLNLERLQQPLTTEERLKQIKERVFKATPAPWYVNYLDDACFMNLVAVTTRPDSGMHEALCDPETQEIRDSIIATTLLQADIGEGKQFVEVQLHDDNDTDSDGYPKYNQWDEDAEFIAHARADIEWLISVIEGIEQ